MGLALRLVPLVELLLSSRVQTRLTTEHREKQIYGFLRDLRVSVFSVSKEFVFKSRAMTTQGCSVR
jgi:hypothetical protein